MAENVRLALDVLALLAVIYAILRGVFWVGSDMTNVKMQIQLHAKWIEEHQECARKQIAILNELRYIVAHLKGRCEAEGDFIKDFHDHERE